MSINSNEPAAQYYDSIYSALRPTNLTESEISLINFLAEPGSKILDLGGGTGRHATILANQNFKVTVVDSSKGMIKELQKKDPSINTINKNIYKTDLKRKYSLIILMWNTFNEIALTKKDAVVLLKKLKNALQNNGTILINIDDSTKVNPSNFLFNIDKATGEVNIKAEWKTYKYNKRTNTSVSKETIQVYKNDTLIDTKTGYIKQRYWRLSEIEALAKQCGLSISLRNIPGINELYILLQ